MKAWLTKFRISAALDAGKPLPESVRRAIAADPELERFARRTQEFGRALRSPPRPEPALHDSIMRAVRAAARQERPRRAAGAVWWTAWASAGAVAAACFWLGFHRPARSGGRSLEGAAIVLEMSEKMPKEMPSLVMAPLSDEWARVDHDLQNTKQVLLASFP